MRTVSFFFWVPLLLVCSSFLFFACISIHIPAPLVPNLQDRSILDSVVSILSPEATPSDHINSDTPLLVHGNDTVRFALEKKPRVEYSVLFREQPLTHQEMEEQYLYEIGLIHVASGTFPITITASRTSSSRIALDPQSSVDLWLRVENHPPQKPFNPNPAHQSSHVPVFGAILSWESDDEEGDPILYSLFFGKDPEDLVQLATLTEPFFPLDPLESSTQYYWRVDTDDGRTTGKREPTFGDLWTFITGHAYTLTLTVSPSEGGSVEGAGRYVAGQEVTVTATPEDGYRFRYWVRGCCSVSHKPIYAFTMPAQNLTLVAHFLKN